MKQRTTEEQNEHEESLLEEIKEDPPLEEILEQRIKQMEEEGNPHI